MRRRLDGKRAFAFAALTASLALAGCGGGDEGGGGGGDATFDAGEAVIAEPGSTRALGERAFVEYEGIGPEFEPDAKTTLAVTVEKVDEGDSSDIDGLGESTVPFYVHLEYENHGEGGIKVLGIDSHLSVQGSDGEEYNTEGVIEISGEFEQCPDAESDATLAPEQALNDCVVVTLTEGVSPKQVSFRGNLISQDEPIGWTVG